MNKVPIELDISAFESNPVIIQKLFRLRDYYNKNHSNHVRSYGESDTAGYILENNDLDYAYVDGSGIMPMETYIPPRDESNEYTQFRPAFTLKHGKLRLYTVGSFGARGGHTHHLILPMYKPVAWVVCDVESYNPKTKECIFTAFDDLTAQHVEAQHQSGQKLYKFSLLFDNNKVNYEIRSTDDPEVFIQYRVDDKNRRRHVLRIPNEKARILTVKNEIRLAVPDKSSEKILLNTVLEENLNVTKFDKLYEEDQYKSRDYHDLILQKDMFDREYGYLSRDEAYYIMSYFGGLDTEIVIDVQ